MKNIKGVFRNFEKKLTQASWFDDEWCIYNRGEYLQLYKDSWHNHNQGGVHFETFIEANEIRKKEFHVRLLCLYYLEKYPLCWLQYFLSRLKKHGNQVII